MINNKSNYVLVLKHKLFTARFGNIYKVCVMYELCKSNFPEICFRIVI